MSEFYECVQGRGCKSAANGTYNFNSCKIYCPYTPDPSSPTPAPTPASTKPELVPGKIYYLENNGGCSNNDNAVESPSFAFKTKESDVCDDILDKDAVSISKILVNNFCQNPLSLPLYSSTNEYGSNVINLVSEYQENEQQTKYISNCARVMGIQHCFYPEIIYDRITSNPDIASDLCQKFCFSQSDSPYQYAQINTDDKKFNNANIYCRCVRKDQLEEEAVPLRGCSSGTLKLLCKKTENNDCWLGKSNNQEVANLEWKEFEPPPSPLPTPVSTPLPSTLPSSQQSECAVKYGQCGGSGWDGPTCCTDGLTCSSESEWNSQCY